MLHLQQNNIENIFFNLQFDILARLCYTVPERVEKDMAHLDIAEMQRLQKVLQEKHKNVWAAICPEEGRNKLLWAVAECGEAAQVIKKQGDAEIMQSEKTRSDFVEELCDVFMYLTDVLNCYNITPEEFEEAYRKKSERNLDRW